MSHQQRYDSNDNSIVFMAPVERRHEHLMIKKWKGSQPLKTEVNSYCFAKCDGAYCGAGFVCTCTDIHSTDASYTFSVFDAAHTVLFVGMEGKEEINWLVCHFYDQFFNFFFRRRVWLAGTVLSSCGG